MRRFLASILGILLGANALWMLAMPMHWYAHIPGVTETGPANVHFIRDIGCAYLVAALALLWFAVAPKRSWPAVLAGGGFLFLHAFIHVWDTMASREHSTVCWPKSPRSSCRRYSRSGSGGRQIPFRARIRRRIRYCNLCPTQAQRFRHLSSTSIAWRLSFQTQTPDISSFRVRQCSKETHAPFSSGTHLHYCSAHNYSRFAGRRSLREAARRAFRENADRPGRSFR
jgi:hypothetical protein